MEAVEREVSVPRTVRRWVAYQSERLVPQQVGVSDPCGAGWSADPAGEPNYLPREQEGEWTPLERSNERDPREPQDTRKPSITGSTTESSETQGSADKAADVLPPQINPPKAAVAIFEDDGPPKAPVATDAPLDLNQRPDQKK